MSEDGAPERDAPAEGGTSSRRAKRRQGADERTTLANERTLLAWFRTALALLAASFAVVKLTDISPDPLRLALGVYLNALAVVMVLASYVQWRTRQRRISGPEPPSRRPGAPLLTVALLVLAGFVTAVTVLAP
ncbi:YidH family protein [Streptomyces sp. NPDC002640]